MYRQLIIGERIMYGDGTTPLTAVLTLKIQDTHGVLTPQSLRQALAKVQAKHPLLRVGIREDANGRPYFVTNEQITPIPIRTIERHTDDDWLQESAKLWTHLFDIKNGPLAGLVWIKGPTESELLLYCHHCICDGTSFVTLMRELLLLLDQPELEMEQYRSFDAIQDVIPAKVLSSRKLRLEGRILPLFAGLALRLMTPKHIVSKSSHYALHWKLSAAASAALLNRCKTERTTVHTALCVALLRAFRQVKGAKARNRIISPVDIRRFIAAIKQDTLFAYAPIIYTQLRHNITDFWEQARTLKMEMAGKIGKVNAYEQLMMGEYFHAHFHGLLKLFENTEGSHDVTISNLGRIDIPERYASFDVQTVYSPTVAFPWRNPNTFVATTFRGRMDFAFISSEGFLPYADAVAIKEYAMALLQQETEVLPAAQA
jgi:NRPS condensation-like uncharacterized protein